MQSNTPKVSFSTLGEAFKHAQSFKAFIIYISTIITAGLILSMFVGIIDVYYGNFTNRCA